MQPGHNSDSASRLRSFVDRIVRLEEEKKQIAGDIRDILQEAKGAGFDAGALKRVVRERMETPDQRAARRITEEIADVYRAALGMLDGTPLGDAAAGDPRRAAWDEGWCLESGSDGMDIPAAWRRPEKKKGEPKPDPGPGPGSGPGGEA